MKMDVKGQMDYAKKLKLRFRVGGWTCQKEERDTPVVGRRREKMHRRDLVAKRE